jgi:hypothetical protein
MIHPLEQTLAIVTFHTEANMDADALDRLVFHVTVIGGLIALMLLPW